jgi:hypothetical protein
MPHLVATADRIDYVGASFPVPPKPGSIPLFIGASAYSHWSMPEGPVRRRHDSHAGASRCARRATRNAGIVSPLSMNPGGRLEP